MNSVLYFFLGGGSFRQFLGHTAAPLAKGLIRADHTDQKLKTVRSFEAFSQVRESMQAWIIKQRYRYPLGPQSISVLNYLC